MLVLVKSSVNRLLVGPLNSTWPMNLASPTTLTFDSMLGPATYRPLYPVMGPFTLRLPPTSMV